MSLMVQLMFGPTEDKARPSCSLHGDPFPYTPHTAWPLLSARCPHTQANNKHLDSLVLDRIQVQNKGK